MNDVSRHSQIPGEIVNELEFDYNLGSNHYPLGCLRSLQDVFSAVQHEEHLSRPENFSNATAVECFKVQRNTSEWLVLDEASLDRKLDATVKGPVAGASYTRGLLVLFVPLTPTESTSFGSRISMPQGSVEKLFSVLDLHPLFILNMLGRPDYWAPQMYSLWEEDGSLSATGTLAFRLFR